MVASELDTAEKMMIHLSTEARAEDKGKEEKTIYKMKSADDFDSKVKALGGVLKADLALTYAFLLDTNIEDTRVAKLTTPGLQKMIALRCSQLTPQWCFPCGGKPFHFSRGEVPVIECRRCKRGACPKCFSQEDVRHLTKFRHLCKECDEIVHDDMGEGRLLTSDFDKAWAKKNAGKTAAEKTNPEKEAPKDDGDEPTLEEAEKTSPEKEASKDDGDEPTLEEAAPRPSQKDMFQTSGEEIKSSESNAEDEEDILQRQKNKKLLEKRRDDKKLRQRENKKIQPNQKKKDTVCPHLKKGRCHYGLSGRKHNKNKSSHDEKQCRDEKLCECPFSHPLVCGKLLRRGAGRNGCKKESDCPKLHPQICPNSLKGVCHLFGCNLGLHIQGTNTKEAREKDNKEREEERRGPSRRGRTRDQPAQDPLRHPAPGAPDHQDPHLPAPSQPQALTRVLGQQHQAPAAAPTPAATPTPAAAPTPLSGQAGITQETASFLGQLLLGELMRLMRQQETPSPRVEGRQEVRKEGPTLSLEAMLRGLNLQQQY